MTDIANNPQALGAFIEHLGGTPIAHERFRFEIPLSETRRVIPEVNKLNLRCEKVAERQTADINGRMHSVATIEISRPPEKTSYDRERDLMSILIR